MRRLLWVLGLMGILIGVGCDSLPSVGESPQDRLVRLKLERIELLDALYGEYGGGSVAKAAGAAATQVQANTGASSIVDLLVGAVGEGDRQMFEANCGLIGDGERPATFSTKASEFFGQAAIKTRCIKMGTLSREIKTLEVEIGAAP